MTAVALALVFLVCAVGALGALLLLVPRDVPPIGGTAALILTLVALGAALLR
ncbi:MULTISPECIES: hypothetical protein [unclassified Streptomyces]|uniref:hypothetical protein n=1 Tax=unclassified Streptomyces TaxID=2593676 RepID=UPI000361A19B|nr:hypothetical protein [Streptomyces sp. LaPpAH-202]